MRLCTLVIAVLAVASGCDPAGPSAELPVESRRETGGSSAEPVQKLSLQERRDVLWLARVTYSETKNAREMYYIAWVVRNRVETEYRNAGSYRDAVLDPYQFSAFNTEAGRRRYIEKGLKTPGRKWKQALEIARFVYFSPETRRPFGENARHFYAERSMVGGREPAWAKGKTPLRLPEVDPRRLRVYEGVR